MACEGAGVGDSPSYRRHHTGIGAPGYHGLQGTGIELHKSVEHGPLVCGEVSPLLDGGLEVFSLRGVGEAPQVLKGNVVGSDHSSAGASLDGHIAHGHSTVHRERPDGFPCILDDVARSAANADLGNDTENDILGGYADGQAAVDPDLHGAGLVLAQGLGRKNMLHLGGAYPQGQGPKGAVRRGMAVAADDDLSRLCISLLWSDYMHDSL